MKTMSKEEEIILVQEMIHQTEGTLAKGGKDRLHLEAELRQLQGELLGLLFPKGTKESLTKKCRL